MNETQMSQHIQQVNSWCQRQLVGLERRVIYRDRNTTTDINLKTLIWALRGFKSFWYLEVVKLKSLKEIITVTDNKQKQLDRSE